MTFEMHNLCRNENILCRSGQVSWLVSATEGDFPGSRGCGRGTKRVEDTSGTGDYKYKTCYIQKIIDNWISVGSNSDTGPAAVLAAGWPEGSDDRAAQTQAAHGWALAPINFMPNSKINSLYCRSSELGSKLDKYWRQTLKLHSVITNYLVIRRLV